MVDQLLPLRVRGATMEIRGKRIVGPLDLDVAADGTTIVMGPNGSGKTTMLRMIYGLARLSAGSLTWSLPIEKARTRQAFVTQTPTVLRRSVIDNIAYPLLLRDVVRREARERAWQWAERVGLAAALGREAAVLSGGEKQKLAIARALITNPELLFLDEPTTHLDGRSTAEIEMILGETRARGTRIIMATHAAGQARRLATDVVFMYRGTIHEHQCSPDFFLVPETSEVRAFLNGDIVE